MNIKGLTEGKDYTRTENERYTRYRFLNTPKGNVQESVEFKGRTAEGEKVVVMLATVEAPKEWLKPFEKYAACVVEIVDIDDTDKAKLRALHKYNPQVKWFETAVFCGYQVDPIWALEDTEANRLTLIEKVYELAFGKEK